MNTKCTTSSLAFRVWHQLTLEWRAQWFLVMLWLVALAVGCWQSLQDERPGIALPDSLPALLALIIIVRSVRLDAPGNTETTSHTRPMGRGAVWAAKVVFFEIALLLPWLACAWPECRGYGFGAVEWLAELVGRLLPALWVGGLAALGASWGGAASKNTVITGTAVLAAAGFYWLLFQSEICAAAVAQGVMGVALVPAWWWVSLRRGAWGVLLVGGALAVAAALWWPGNWVVRPEPRFVETQVALHFGEPPAGSAQELWPGVYLTGLPADCVASIVSLAPTEGALVFSDYSGVAEKSGKRTTHARWMTMNHMQALVPHYPRGSLWHGHPDVAREPLVKTMAGQDTAKPWRLRLSVQHMRRIISTPLGSADNPQEVLIQPGVRFEYALRDLNDNSQTRFWTRLRSRVPKLAPHDDDAALRAGDKSPARNLIALLNSPSIHEVCACHEDTGYEGPELLFLPFPHPRAQMDIAGLKLEDWMADTTLDFWWPEERGVVDLEISAEEMGRLVRGSGGVVE